MSAVRKLRLVPIFQKLSQFLLITSIKISKSNNINILYIMLILKSNNYQVYNLRPWVNVNSLRPDFNKRKVATFKRNQENHKVYLTSSNFNILSSRFNEEMLMRSILFVMEKRNLSAVNIEMIKLDYPFEIQLCNKVAGVMTISRENVMGGWFKSDNFERELTPAELIIPPDVMDVVISPLEIIDPNNESYVDLVLYKC